MPSLTQALPNIEYNIPNGDSAYTSDAFLTAYKKLEALKKVDPTTKEGLKTLSDLTEADISATDPHIARLVHEQGQKLGLEALVGHTKKHAAKLVGELNKEESRFLVLNYAPDLDTGSEGYKGVSQAVSEMRSVNQASEDKDKYMAARLEGLGDEAKAFFARAEDTIIEGDKERAQKIAGLTAEKYGAEKYVTETVEALARIEAEVKAKSKELEGKITADAEAKELELVRPLNSGETAEVLAKYEAERKELAKKSGEIDRVYKMVSGLISLAANSIKKKKEEAARQAAAPSS